MLKDASIQSRRFGGLTWWVRVPFLTPEVAGILEDADGFLRRSRLFKNDRSAFIAAGQGYVVKRSNQPKRRNLLIDVFRGSRARRAFANALHMEKLGIATARPIATADRRKFGLPSGSYLVAEEISSAIDLGEWAGDKKAAIESVAKLIAALHNAGFRHGDLKETNVLFDPSGRPHLIDMDALRRYRRLPDSHAARDLSRLWRVRFRTSRYSRTDALRFLIAYCRHRDLADARQWWGRVAAIRRKDFNPKNKIPQAPTRKTRSRTNLR